MLATRPVAEYVIVADPPVAGAVKARETTVSLVLVAVPTVGAFGTVVAVIELDAVPEDPVPVAFGFRFY